IVFLVGDDLHEAFRLARDLRAAEHAEREGADDDVEAAFFSFGFGETDAADFRIAVRAARDVIVVDRLRILSGDSLRENYALGARQMRELRMRARAHRDDVANRGDAGDVRAEEIVDFDVAALVDHEAGFFRAEPVGDGTATGGDEKD